jgi:hypothetical protein
MDILKQELLKERIVLEKRIAAINVLLNTATEADVKRLISSIQEQDNVKNSPEEKTIIAKDYIKTGDKITPMPDWEKIRNKKKETIESTKICPICNHEFELRKHQPNQVYCSHKCRHIGNPPKHHKKEVEKPEIASKEELTEKYKSFLLYRALIVRDEPENLTEFDEIGERDFKDLSEIDKIIIRGEFNLNQANRLKKEKLQKKKAAEKRNIEKSIKIQEPIKEVIKNKELSSEDEIQRAKEDIKFRDMWG